MIRNRDFYANPYRDHARMNGIRTGRQGWRDMQADQDQLDAGADILKVLVGCLVLWALLALAIVGAVHLLDKI